MRPRTNLKPERANLRFEGAVLRLERAIQILKGLISGLRGLIGGLRYGNSSFVLQVIKHFGRGSDAKTACKLQNS